MVGTCNYNFDISTVFELSVFEKSKFNCIFNSNFIFIKKCFSGPRAEFSFIIHWESNLCITYSHINSDADWKCAMCHITCTMIIELELDVTHNQLGHYYVSARTRGFDSVECLLSLLSFHWKQATRFLIIEALLYKMLLFITNTDLNKHQILF